MVDLPVDYSQNVKELITDLRDHKPIVLGNNDASIRGNQSL